MSFFPYFVCVLLGVDSLRGGLAEGNRIALPKAIELLFVGGSMAFGVCTNCLSSFPPSIGQKWKILQNTFLILTMMKCAM